MTRTLHIAVGAAILCSATACADVIGVFGSDDASVVADLTSERLSLMIRNDGDDAILYQSGCNLIEQREDGEWQERAGAPIPVEGTKVFCTHQLGPPTRIEAGDEYRREWKKVEAWESGEYRFKLDLTDEDGRKLSEDVRTSNTFRIDG